MKFATTRPLAVTLAAAFTLCASTFVGATDNFGEYTLGEVRIDGAAWTDASTEITIAKTFALEIDLSYDELPDPFILAQHQYFPNQNVELILGSPTGETLANASAAAPTSSTLGFLGDIDLANWTLTGTGIFDGNFGSEGIYDVFTQRTPATYSIGDGLFPNFEEISRQITVAVPLPGTLLLLAAGALAVTRVGRSRR